MRVGMGYSPMSQESATKICILGGGFGGLYTAVRLNQLPWDSIQQPEITLVDRCDRFVFTPLLYELLTGELQTWEIAPPYAELLQNTAIRFCQGNVKKIDIDQRLVQLDQGRELNYDRVVLALGGETPLDFVPGASSYAYPFRTIADAYRLQEKLRLLESSKQDNIRIALVGGGYSGVELACKLADRFQQRAKFRLIEMGTDILANSPDFNRQAARKALTAKGVFLDLETKVTQIAADQMSLEYKGNIDTIPVDLVLWTVGTQINPVVRDLPLEHNQRGQICTNPTLQAIAHPEIFALGDLAQIRDANRQVVPATAQAAFQQADYTAWNVWASLTNRPLLPFKYQHLGEMMALGVDNATLSGLGVQLDGPLAYVARRLAYLYRMPTWEHQLRVGLNWLTQPIVDAIA